MFKSLKEKLKGWIKRTKEESKEIGDKNSVKEPKRERKVSKKEKILPKKEPLSKKEIKEKPKEKKSIFSKFKKKLTKEKFDKVFEELELILLQNNVAYKAIESIKRSLEEKLVGESSSSDIQSSLREAIEELLLDPPNFLKEITSCLKKESPFVILFSGINGSGKTTTIAKIAKYLLDNKISVCLAAADTFRAASIEQIQQHAKKLDIHLIKKDYGSDPASVGFDAIVYAKKNKIDVVLIDTAGRMQNKDSLMREIEKITRVTSPHMKIFLGESITGNDATNQAESFNEAIDLTGIILSKADIDEKGGTAISVSQVTSKPILFLGTGQNYEDLEIFNKEKLIEKLGL